MNTHNTFLLLFQNPFYIRSFCLWLVMIFMLKKPIAVIEIIAANAAKNTKIILNSLPNKYFLFHVYFSQSCDIIGVRRGFSRPFNS